MGRLEVRLGDIGGSSAENEHDGMREPGKDESLSHSQRFVGQTEHHFAEISTENLLTPGAPELQIPVGPFALLRGLQGIGRHQLPDEVSRSPPARFDGHVPTGPNAARSTGGRSA